MEITEVRIKLMEESEDRLRAFCSITIDHCFVVRDLKIIAGTSGPFVAMPSRKLTERCPKCGYKNHLRSNYCNQCGNRIRHRTDENVSANKLYADIAHPINQHCRDIIQTAVVQEYHAELERAKLPGYISRYDDEYADTTRTLTDEEQLDLFDTDDGPDLPSRKTDSRSRIDPPQAGGSKENRERRPGRRRNDQPTTDHRRTDGDSFGQGIL